MNVSVSSEQITSLISDTAFRNCLLLSDWRNNLVSWNLCGTACLNAFDVNIKLPESKVFGTGRNCKNSLTIIICFPPNGTLSFPVTLSATA